MPRRSEERKRAQVAAQIVRFGQVTECVIRDLSPRGARLRVPDAGKVPAEFELLVRQTGERRSAHVRWRNGTEVGVSFTPGHRTFGRRDRTATPPAWTRRTIPPERIEPSDAPDVA